MSFYCMHAGARVPQRPHVEAWNDFGGLVLSFLFVLRQGFLRCSAVLHTAG